MMSGMVEPNFIAQTAEPAPPDERMVWIKAQIEFGRVAGATFFRASVHPEIPDLTLVEGWIEQPEDQGEPRFQMVSQP
jgi:hypothetical protein